MFTRFDQPLTTCGYWREHCYCVSTVNQIIILDIEKDRRLHQINATYPDENEIEYLIDAKAEGNDFIYFVGKGARIEGKDQQ